MKLYSFPGSCSTSAHISLLEAGVEFDHVFVDLTGDRKLPDGRCLSDINPKNYVPVLELDDGTIITEVIAILHYIGDLKPDSKLMPPSGTMERLRVVELLAYLGAEIYKTFEALRLTSSSDENNKMIRDRFAMRFRFLDDILADKKYLTGDTFTVADAFLITMLDGAPKYYNLDFSPYRHFVRYIEQLGEKASIQKARKTVEEYISADFTRLAT